MSLLPLFSESTNTGYSQRSLFEFVVIPVSPAVGTAGQETSVVGLILQRKYYEL